MEAHHCLDIALGIVHCQERDNIEAWWEFSWLKEGDEFGEEYHSHIVASVLGK